MTVPATTARELRACTELKFAKKGLIIGLLAGVTFAVSSVLFLGEGVRQAPYNQPEFWIVAPLLAAGLHDLTAAFLGIGINYGRGQGHEIWRALASRPGRYSILGALLGAPFGMGGYLLAISMAGAAYALPITSLFPAFATILAIFFLKERVNMRTWLGLGGCILGAFIISYTPPSDTPSSYFYLGILCAVIASAGWACESVLVTSGMDFVEPGIALNIYHMTSGLLYMTVILPLAVHFTVPGQSYFSVMATLLDSPGTVLICIAGIIGCISYLCWYIAMNTTGVSRALALNITYALWGVILSAIFLDVEITTALVVGSIIIFLGMVLVAGKPSDLINLRKVD